MDSSEEEDYKKILHRNGYSETDFNISSEDKTVYPPDGGITTIHEEITITNIRSGKTKIYQGGHGTSWPSIFENDLKNHCF